MAMADRPPFIAFPAGAAIIAGRCSLMPNSGCRASATYALICILSMMASIDDTAM
jgi:hypothetical protein